MPEPLIIDPGVEPVYELDSRSWVDENVRNLEQAGEVGAGLITFYQAAVAEAPMLEDVEILCLGSDDREELKFTGGFIELPTPEDHHYKICLNTKGGFEHYRSIYALRKNSFDISAQHLGIAPDELSKPETLSAYILGHETGHRRDFGNTSPAEVLARIKRELLELYIPGFDPVSLRIFFETPIGQQYMIDNERALKVDGITTVEQILSLQEVGYRDTPSEAVADRFAGLILDRVLKS